MNSQMTHRETVHKTHSYGLYSSVQYNSGSQPGVHVPLVVRKHITGGTWKYLFIYFQDVK